MKKINKPSPRPVLIVAASASVAIWSGWVELGKMVGFGVVQLLPGIWEDLQINTAITLPLGMEAYAAFALRVWLATPGSVNWRARRFAGYSSIAALILGIAGQITYHLLSAAGYHSAPWPVTAVVSSLPVGVLALAASLANLMRDVPTPEPERPTGPAERTVELPRVEVIRPPVTPGTAPRPAWPPMPEWDVPAQTGTILPCRATENAAQDQNDRSEGHTSRVEGRSSRSDEELLSSIVTMSEKCGGKLPSIYAVKHALNIGSNRATRLIGQLTV